MKCLMRSASVKCGVRGVKNAVRRMKKSVHLALHCTGVARRSCAWTATAQQVLTKQARTGLAGARRMQVL